MNFSDIPLPEVYKSSADFRFFLRWIEVCLTDAQYKTDNLIDLLDPLRCPANLLWLLGDTVGYKYDERASKAFNRLVILYFAKLIRYRGSETGMTLAAEMNLAEFNLQKYAEEDEILEDRLEDTSIPANAVNITPNPELGYIDIVYYSENIPTDVCTEYVRPLGMYCFSHAGVRVNGRAKLSIDARLTNVNDGNIKPGPAFIAHYRREDYARLQQYLDPQSLELKPRNEAYYRNSDFEKTPTTLSFIDPGYRSISSLQLSNNEHIVKALMPSLEEIDPIFDIGNGPQSVDVVYPDNYLKTGDDPFYNLRINKALEESLSPRVFTIETADDIKSPKPGVNPPMMVLGDAISMNNMNTDYTKYDSTNHTIKRVQLDDNDLDDES